LRLTNLLSCAVVTKSGNLNFLEPSGPFQACNGTALPFLHYKLTKENKQCTYNVILRRVPATIVAVGKAVLHILCVCVCVCVCSLIYPTCNARAPYCHLWPTRFYFATLFKKQHDCRKKFRECETCILIFSTDFMWNVSHSKTNRERFD